MEKERSEAAFTKIFDDKSFPFFSIGIMNASCADAACVEHSGGVFCHEAPANVLVFVHEFLYTMPQRAPYKDGKYLFTVR